MSLGAYMASLELGAADSGDGDETDGGSRTSWTGELSSLNATALDDGWIGQALSPEQSIAEETGGFNGPTFGQDERVEEKFHLRVGQSLYGSLVHLDLADNWVLAVAGWKRAVLLHPFSYRCLQIDEDSERESFRQSPLPVSRAKEWLAEHCPADEWGGAPLALQHVFEVGDLLFIPVTWLHHIETGPPEGGGWWISLNRFFKALPDDCHAQSAE